MKEALGINQLSVWLLLNHPLVWRQRPALGAMLAVACLLPAIALSALPAFFPLPLDLEQSSIWYLFLSTVSAIVWLTWFLRRENFQTSQVSLRKRLGSPAFVDAAIWVAFLLPGPLCYSLFAQSEALLIEELLYITVPFYVMPLIAFFGSLFMKIITPRGFEKLNDLIFSLHRGDLLIPSFLHARVRAHETVLASRYPRVWYFNAYPYLCFGIYTAIAIYVIRITVGGFGPYQFFSIFLLPYVLGLLLSYRVATRVGDISALQQHASAWWWVLCDALLTVGVVFAVSWVAAFSPLHKPDEGVAKFINALWSVEPHLTPRIFLAGLWAWLLLQMLFVWKHSKLRGLSSILTHFAVYVAAVVGPLFAPIWATLILVLLWCICATYLALLKAYSSHLDYETRLARLLTIAAGGFVLQRCFAASDFQLHVSAPTFWPELTVNLGLAFLLWAGAFKVLRAQTVVPGFK